MHVSLCQSCVPYRPTQLILDLSFEFLISLPIHHAATSPSSSIAHPITTDRNPALNSHNIPRLSFPFHPDYTKPHLPISSHSPNHPFHHQRLSPSSLPAFEWHPVSPSLTATSRLVRHHATLPPLLPLLLPAKLLLSLSCNLIMEHSPVLCVAVSLTTLAHFSSWVNSCLIYHARAVT